MRSFVRLLIICALLGGIVGFGVIWAFEATGSLLLQKVVLANRPAVEFAEWCLLVFGDPRGIAPSRGEIQIYNAALVIAFSIEAMFLGMSLWICLLSRGGGSLARFLGSAYHGE